MWVPLLSQLPARVSPEIFEGIFFSRVAWLWSFVGWSGFVPSVWYCLFIKDRSLRQRTVGSLQFSLSFSSVYEIDCFHFHMQKETHSFLVWYASLDICFLFGSNWCKKRKQKGSSFNHSFFPKAAVTFFSLGCPPCSSVSRLIVIHFLCFLFLVCADRVPVREIQRKGSQKSSADTWEETRLTPKRYCCNSITL